MEPGTVTRVLKDVFTTMDGELSLSKGDILQVIKTVDKYWCYGNSTGKVGLFPTAQLIAIETPDVNSHEDLFLAIADFAGEQGGDLKFWKGEFIVGEKKLDEHWWQGRISHHRRGVFPDTFTWHLNPIQQKHQKKSSTMNVMARVKMSLKAQLDEEMDLHIGDIVTITEETDVGWYRGTSGNRCGIFPAAYVTLLEESLSIHKDPNQHAQGSSLSNNFENNAMTVTANNNNFNSSYNNGSIAEKSYSNVTGGDSLKDLMTFSPEKEIKKEIKSFDNKPLISSDIDILNDDYFKVNMPSIYSGSTSIESNLQSYSDCLGSKTDSSNSSYLTELVSELDDCNIQPYGMTLYPFYAQYANELSFHENEIIHLIRYVDNEWLEGEIDGRKGIFPVSYINILVDCDIVWRNHTQDVEDESNQNDLFVKSYAKVEYSFDAQMNGDLSVKEGDVVMVMKIVDGDWCEVRNKSGSTGLCPSNHLVAHNVLPSEALIRSSSFSSNSEALSNSGQSRTYEPHDFSFVSWQKRNKVEDLISKNLSGLDALSMKRKSPVDKGFIDYKDELAVMKVCDKNSDLNNDALHNDSSDLKEESPELKDFDNYTSVEPPDYPPPPPPCSARPVLPNVIEKSCESDTQSEQLKVRKPAPPIPPDLTCHQVDLHGTATTPMRPQRPPPPSRRISIDRAPHRPAPPVPIAGQTPVRRSLRRLPRQTSAPCVLSEEPNDNDEVKGLINKKEKQLQEIQMVHEEIESEIEQTSENDPRAEQLRECGALYEKKIRRLKMDIQHFRNKLDKAEASSSTANRYKHASSKCSEEKRKKMNDQRQNVISELVMTEKEYVRDLKMTYEVFNLHNPSMLQERGIDDKALFGNILEVLHAAEEFLDSLQYAMKGHSDENQCVGPVFLKHAVPIKEVYSEYCTNHENALSLLDKYKTLPAAQAVFDKAMETLRHQITCFNVGSVLIKPVQRLLKYPLILNELIKCTEDTHKDKPDLLQAVKVYTNMASDINEYKRRKDIVSKYLGDGTSTLARKMAKLNLHSVAKKSSRLSAKLSSSLGLSMAPKDELFLEQERSFHSLERTLRMFLRNLDVLMNYLTEEVTALFHLGEVLAMFYMERTKDQDVDEFRTTQRLIMSQYWAEFKNVVERRVTCPIMSLLELFEGPCKLIEKRNDKLLDYDTCLAKADKNKENRQFQDELLRSKNNYEALNQQLLEDLPKLITASTGIVVECLSALLAARKLLSGKITKQYLNLLEVPSLSSTAGDAVEAFAVKHYLVCNQLGRFSFSSKTFKESGGNKKSLKTSPTPCRQLGADGQKLEQSASQRAYLQSKYPSDKLFCTIEDHVVADSLDLALSKGHLVGVVKKQDPMGGSFRWFVDNGEAQGFVRSNCLEPAAAILTSSPLSADSSRSSCGTPSPNKLRPDSASSGRSSVTSSSPRQSVSPPKVAVKQSHGNKPDGMPPSYEEVTGTIKGQALYDSVPQETQHRYEEVPDISIDSSNIYEEIHTGDEVECPDKLGSPYGSEFYYTLYEFSGMGPHTLPLNNGQVVNILQKQDLQGNKEWWYAEDRYGKKGYVPANYLHPYTDA